jgi:hypothetical protein
MNLGPNDVTLDPTQVSVLAFRDVYDHLIRISDLIDSYRDRLTGRWTSISQPSQTG